MKNEKPFKKDYALDTYMNEMEWDDACSDARFVLDQMKERGKTIIWLTAGKIDWQGHSGFKIGTIDEIDDPKGRDGDLWSWISGIDGDWSLSFVADFDPVTDSKMYMSCSHHDQPMGGERVVTFYSPKEFYELAREKGMTLKEMQDWVYENSYCEHDQATSAIIIDCISQMDKDDLQDFIDS